MQQWRSFLGQKVDTNILFTSIGRRVELIRSFHRAFQELEITGKIVGTDVDPLAPAMREVDKPYIVPHLKEADFSSNLLEICRRERISAIFPLIDYDIPVLSAFRMAIEATGAKLGIVPSSGVEITNDKWLTTQFFRNLDIKTPKSWLPDQIDLDTVTYPVFIKPRCGSASQHTYRITNERELIFFIEYVPNPIIQEYLSGPEITNDVICDFESNILGISSRQRIQVRGGEVTKGITIRNETILSACYRIADALPAFGPITVQCILKNNEPYFTEINARMGGGLPLGIAAGVDAPKWLLANLAGISLSIPPIGTYQTGLYLTRFDDSHFVTKAQREKMASNRI